MAKDTLSSVVLDPMKKIFSAKPKAVKPEPVQNPAKINLATLTNASPDVAGRSPGRTQVRPFKKKPCDKWELVDITRQLDIKPLG